MWSQLKIATLMLIVLTVLTGVVYPLVVTGAGAGSLSGIAPAAAWSCATARWWAPS